LTGIGPSSLARMMALGSMATADMVADDPGTWTLHCHVAEHIAAGMLTTYTINP